MNFKKLSVQNFVIILIAIIISIFSIAVLWINDFYMQEHKNFDAMKYNYIKEQKTLLKTQLNNIKYNLETVISVCNNQKSLNQKEIQKIILNKLRKYRFEKDGYIFVLNTKGVMLMHPINPNLEGKNVFNVHDVNGKYIVKELIKNALSKNSHFVKYVWQQPSTGKFANKISYSVYIPKWNWIIGSGLYIDNINNVLEAKYKELKKRVRKRILKVLAVFFLIVLIVGYFVYTRIKKINSSFMLFHNFLKKAHNTSRLIDLNKLEYEEFKSLAKDINDMILKRIEMEKELEEKNNQLLQQTHLAQKTEMLNMIAHQWRQPLTAISAAAVIINLKAEANELDNKTAIKLANEISDYSQHLSKIIDNFKNFFKKDSIKTETTWNQLIDDVLKIVKESLEDKNIKLIKELDCKNKFFTYSNDVKQVILNLIKNSMDILSERNIKNPYIKIKTFKKNNKCIFEISDNGGGIADEIINKIFHPYFSTKIEKNGKGLGLYMSKIIIDEHCGGKLSVKNDKFGAVFTIELNN